MGANSVSLTMVKLVQRNQGMAFEKQNIVPRIKHGGCGVMIWRCMAASEVCLLTFIDSTLDHIEYLNV